MQILTVVLLAAAVVLLFSLDTKISLLIKAMRGEERNPQLFIE